MSNDLAEELFPNEPLQEMFNEYQSLLRDMAAMQEQLEQLELTIRTYLMDTAIESQQAGFTHEHI